MTSAPRFDTVIVGGGLAGLTAARELARHGRSCCVLEARERVGGRTLSHGLLSDTIDLGGQWIGPTQHRVRALAAELGVATFPQYQAGRKILALAGKRQTYRGTIPGIAPLALLDLQLALWKIDWLARQVPTAAAFTAPHARAWDTQTMAEWMTTTMRTEAAQAVLTGAIRAVFAAEPHDLSLLFVLFYARSAGGIMKLVEIRGGAQEWRLIGGAQQLSIRLAAQPGVQVICDTPVTAIRQDADGVDVVTGGQVYRASRAVVAVPPAVAQQIAFDPLPPPNRAALLAQVPMGRVIKCIIAYRTPFWREQGFSGEVVTDGAPGQIVFDDSPHDTSFGALVMFILGDAATTWAQRSRAERLKAVCTQLGALFGPTASTPIAYLDHDWTAERWSKGCYVGIFPPGVLTAHGAALREPFGRIHWAGTETATIWNGYMDGAIESGMRAAHEIGRLG